MLCLPPQRMTCWSRHCGSLRMRTQYSSRTSSSISMRPGYSRSPPLSLQRDPIFVAAFGIEVIRFKPGTAERLKPPAAVVDGFAGLGEGDPANSCRTAQAVGLALDVHDSRFQTDSSLSAFVIQPRSEPITPISLTAPASR